MEGGDDAVASVHTQHSRISQYRTNRASFSLVVTQQDGSIGATRLNCADTQQARTVFVREHLENERSARSVASQLPLDRNLCAARCTDQYLCVPFYPGADKTFPEVHTLRLKQPFLLHGEHRSMDYCASTVAMPLR